MKRIIGIIIGVLLIIGIGGVVLNSRINKPKTAAPVLPSNYTASNSAKIAFVPKTIDTAQVLNKKTSVDLVVFPEKNEIGTITINLGFDPTVISQVEVIPLGSLEDNTLFTFSENKVDTKSGEISLVLTSSAANSSTLPFKVATIEFTPIKNVANSQIFYFLPGTNITGKVQAGTTIQSAGSASSILKQVVPLKSK